MATSDWQTSRSTHQSSVHVMNTKSDILSPFYLFSLSMGSREKRLAHQLTTAPQCSLCQSVDGENTVGTTVTSSESELKVVECKQSSIFGKWLVTGNFLVVQLTICWSNVFQKSLVRLSNLSITQVYLLAAPRCDRSEDRKSIQWINKSVQRNHSLNFMSPGWKNKEAQGRDWKGFKLSRGDIILLTRAKQQGNWLVI